MLGIIIGTHGRFSEELLKTSEMIFGKQENIETVTFEPGEGSEGLVAKYEAALQKLDREKGVLFLVDLFGGSPFNAASRIAINNENMDILTGVNLPMLLEIYGLRETLSLEDIVSIGESSGKEGIRQFKLGLSKEEEEEL
ncbi:mannose/fructose/sorbose PTS transporter subunit IIA [Clostridium sp. MSJ-4]|uniref:Mannose/fructose/sorbose PTS transporter subunit IIA n=1 Tax=Clostridium simiarum TaxID=2841506 RepID=A0ABS6F1Q5_9CLOT|nr:MULTISPECIES: mannose/fructose/sorbose PTS transporter subunit IIA [Clostridium]MBU5592452.1 mannose/fructose/sorbose PTS transporter subunit IIA [Clostridium simiarum]